MCATCLLSVCVSNHPTRPQPSHQSRAAHDLPLKMSTALGRHAREALARGLRARSLVSRAPVTTTFNHDSHKSWQPSNGALLGSQAGGDGGGGWAQVATGTASRGLAATAACVVGRRNSSTRVCDWAEKPASKAPGAGDSPQRGFSSEADLELAFHRSAGAYTRPLLSST